MSKFFERAEQTRITAANSRAEILSLLRVGPMTVAELCAALSMNHNTLRSQLKRLRSENKARVKGYLLTERNDLRTALYEAGEAPDASQDMILFPDGAGGYTDMERVVVIKTEFEPLNVKPDPLTAAWFGSGVSDE